MPSVIHTAFLVRNTEEVFFSETRIMVLILENSDLNLKLLGMPGKGDDMT